MRKTEKRRAVAYCRVSTDKEAQKTSIKSQRTELRRLCEQKDWYMPRINVESLCDEGVYYDEDESGTKLSRPAFDRLLLDAGLTPVIDADTDKKTTTYKIEKKPKFNIIVIKDTSRYARNILGIAIMRVLKDNGVYVFFCDLQMTTEVDEHWSIIQQYLNFAEDESRRKSKAVSFGYEASIKQGKIYFGGKIIGYNYDSENNRLVVNEEEAKLVRRVFDMYTEEGLGQYRICNALADEGFYTISKTGKKVKYGRSTIKRMLQNEKYCGITNSGRYHKVDLFSGKKIMRDYNDPLRVQARKVQQELLAQGIVKIEPIVSVEQFEKAQAICLRNSEIYKLSGEWHGTTDYAKKIVCECCGAYYRASGKRAYKKYDYKVIRRYVCKHSITFDEEHGIPKCTNPTILEPELDKALFGREYWIYRRVNIEELITTGTFYINVLRRAINADNVQAVKNLDKQIDELKKQRTRALKLYTKGTYDEVELDEINAEITAQINDLTAKQEQLAKGNEDIYKDIELIKELIAKAKAEQAEVEKILDTREYPQKSRRELLRDVERITIDAQGKPHIMFRSLENIKTTIRNMGIMIESYADAEEAGWEEEVAKADEWAKQTGFLQDTDTTPRTLEEVLADIEKHGGKVTGGKRGNKRK